MDKFKFTLWYSGRKNLCQIYNLLEKYRFFKPREIYIDETDDSPYTKNKMNADEIKKRFYDTFNNNSGNCITVSGYGFLLLSAPTIKLGDFYVLSLTVSPKVLKNEYEDFENLFKKSAEIIGAFYGIIDTIDNAGEILEEEHEDVYSPDEYIQALFWGNYFGGCYATHSNVLKMIKSNYCITERVGDSWFVKLSDCMSEYASEKVKRNQKNFGNT